MSSRGCGEPASEDEVPKNPLCRWLVVAAEGFIIIGIEEGDNEVADGNSSECVLTLPKVPTMGGVEGDAGSPLLGT